MTAADDLTVAVATTVDDELVEALTRLLPQLSSSAPPPTAADVAEIVASPSTDLLVARLDGRIVGSLTLALFRIPTGLRAWIEDVVTDEAARGHGVGSRPQPLRPRPGPPAGRLHRGPDVAPVAGGRQPALLRLGFEARQTNVYRFDLGAP